MSTKIIIGIAGNIGAGKGTVANYLVQSYHAHNLRYSHILQDILTRLNLSYNRKNLASLAESLRGSFGEDILSHALIAEIDRVDNNIIVVDGIRKKNELDELRKVDNFYFFYVDAEIKARFDRLTKRNEKADDNTKTFEEFKKDHESLADKDVPSLRGCADFVIDNNGNFMDMTNQVSDIMSELLKKIKFDNE